MDARSGREGLEAAIVVVVTVLVLALVLTLRRLAAEDTSTAEMGSKASEPQSESGAGEVARVEDEMCEKIEPSGLSVDAAVDARLVVEGDSVASMVRRGPGAVSDSDGDDGDDDDDDKDCEVEGGAAVDDGRGKDE